LGATVAAVTRGDGKDVSTTVTVATGDTPGGLSLRFASQTGTAVAVAAGYAANVLVGNDGRVSDVSYVPTSDGPFRDLYDKNRDKIEQLHATVATAARFGAFRFEGDRGQRLRAASIWLETISEFIPADPSLALHTAYAFHDADVVELLKPLRNILADLPALRIFDLALLTGSEASGGYQPRVPMLSRGWAIVDVKGVKLDAEMQEAGEHRQLALWTTFDSKGIAIVESFYGRS
jgi:hypothetical protein